MECKTLEGVDSLVHISRGVLIELSFRWIWSCLAWCPLIREIAGYEACWSSTISLRFYCALLVHFALQWLPMMASPIAPLLFNITSDMTSSQATMEMYSSYVHCQGCSAGAKVLKRQHRRSSAEQPLARSDAKSPEKATLRCLSCSHVRVSSAYFAGGSVYLFYFLLFYFLYLLSCPIFMGRSWASYSHDILYHIFTYLLLNNASFIAYFAWGRAIIWMIIWCRSLSQEKKNIFFSFILF